MLQSIIHEVSNLNGIIIGPGIGRDKFMQDYMADILKQVIYNLILVSSLKLGKKFKRYK